MFSRRRRAVLGAVLALTTVLAACGVDPLESGGPAPGTRTTGSARPAAPGSSDPSSATPGSPSSSSASTSSAAPTPAAPSSPAASSAQPSKAQPWDRKAPNCAKLKCIALTWDDGPMAYTPQLATILTQEKVRGTFFMLGSNVVAYPNAVREVQATGSEIGNHSWNHPSLSKLSEHAIRSQLVRTNEAIEKITGEPVTVMRPPYGANNARVHVVTRELGLAEVYWNVDTLDWKYPSSYRLINYVLANAAPNQVVLMHDIHPSTVEGARAIIQGLKARGYTLVTVSELYPNAKPGVHYPQRKKPSTGSKSRS